MVWFARALLWAVVALAPGGLLLLPLLLARAVRRERRSRSSEAHAHG